MEIKIIKRALGEAGYTFSCMFVKMTPGKLEA
jgi:hypothetical protein